MKKLIPILAALVALAIGALFITDAQAETTASLVTKAVIVAVLALQAAPLMSHRLGLINTTVVANTIQPQYNKKLLDHAVPLTTLVDYAQLEELPANIGATSVRFFRPPAPDLTATGAPTQLTEGQAPANDRDLSFTPVDVSLIQIGQKGRVTDVATTVGLVKFLDSVITLFGEEFALDVDTRLRNILVHQTTGFTKRYAQGKADFATLAAATLAAGCTVPQDYLDAMTRLKLNRAPKIQGHYVAIVPPQGSRDIMNNADWKEVVKYNYADKIFKGEIGDLFGLRIVEGTNPFQEDETEGTYASTFNAAGTNTTGLIYSTIITGKGGYGAVNMKKMGASPHKPQMIIVTGPDKADPLGQYTSVGWKAYWAGVLLNAAWGITLRHKTQFVG
jgi:N4-gp56 family major capsid protein